MPALMHMVSLQQAAGVESQFAEFVLHAVARHPDWTQSWLNPARGMHPFFEARLRPALAHVVDSKYRWGLKLPAKPGALRAWHRRRAFAEAAPDVMMIWNRTTRSSFVLDAVGAERCIHWEHGAAWHGGNEAERHRYFARVPMALANSKAAARVLERLWGYAGQLRVCRNALRPSLVPERAHGKPYPRGAEIRLGVAARLFPVKGIALVLHAVRLLRERSIDVTLQIAGAGVDRPALEALARRLNVAPRVRFLGSVSDMRGFYAGIDCLVHAPVTEAFGLVAIEAGAQGVPVVAAAVDGLPEAVTPGVTGYCVRPELPLAEYARLGGGRLEHLPERVYDPADDALHEPKVVDPAALAAAVERLFASPADYEAMSLAASEHVLREYRFDAHVEAVMGAVEAFAREV